MLLNVVDGQGFPQKIIAVGQETVVDVSGVIAATGVSQVLIPANPYRSGFIMQNCSDDFMYVNDLGNAAAPPETANNGSFVVAAGAFFPPPGYPISTGAISISGTINDTFTARAW